MSSKKDGGKHANGNGNPAQDAHAALPVGALPVGALPVGALPVGALPVGALAVGVLDEALARIAATSRVLNEAAETATHTIERLDERLVDADPGVSVWGDVLLVEKITYQRDDQPAEPAQRTVTLGFAKAKKKKWGLCVREEIKGKKGVTLDEELTLLRKADRGLRLAALPHLEALTLRIVEQLEAQAAQLPGLLTEPEAEGSAEAPSQLPAGEPADAQPHAGV